MKEGNKKEREIEGEERRETKREGKRIQLFSLRIHPYKAGEYIKNYRFWAFECQEEHLLSE